MPPRQLELSFPMIRHERVQQPIGQGFFHTASLDFDGCLIRYIYDCGSISSSAELDACIESYAKETSLADILFLSHLDADHVNGLDVLLGWLNCEIVVLPYLGSYERLLVAIGSVEDGRSSANYLHFLGDPVGWLGARGVRVVVFVLGDDNDDAEPAFPVLPDLPPSRRDEKPRHWHLVDDELVLAQADSAGPPAVRRINHREPLVIDLDGSIQNWCFLTFVHPETDHMQAFRQKVDAAFPNVFVDANPTGGGTILTDQIREVLTDKTKRSKLANCYSAFASSRNHTSMSLYSGPFAALKDYAREEVSTRRKSDTCREIGWLGTGDSPLNVEKRRSHFLKHYKALIPHTRTFALPHHGADRNFDKEILPPNAARFIVSAVSTNKHHPGNIVVSAVEKAAQKPLVRVTEKVKTKLIETFSISSLR